MELNDEGMLPDDGLDRAIRDALWVEVDESSLKRLEDYWLVHSRREMWRRRVLRLLPLATAALLVVAVAIFKWSPSEETQFTRADRQTPPVNDLGTSASSAVSDGVATESQDSTGRLPTTYERFMFAARTRLPSTTESPMARIEAAVNRLVQNPGSDAHQVLDESGVPYRNAEVLLLRRLSGSTASEQTAVLKFLTVCGTARSVPALLHVAESASERQIALSVVERILGVAGLGQVLESTADQELRQAILVRLLTNNSEQAVLEYLSLVHSPKTREEALSVVEGTARVPIGKLITLLDHKEKSVRISAAMVLGHHNGPAVTQLLIDRVLDSPADSTEAWLALMACHGDLVNDFLAYASRRPQLLGYYNGARLQWNRLIQ